MSGARILVVDDTPRNVKLLAELLTGSGYEVVTAASGADALAIVAGGPETRPDLVLLDVVMPGMSGYEVCRAIRSDPATVALPVVLVTALEASSERVKGLEAGADDFVSKPISPPELLARVRSLLRAKDLYDTVERQALLLAEWNRTLEARVATQLGELERLGRLKRFLPPQIVERVVSGDAEDPLRSHRREIAAVFLEVRGLTLFAETSAAEEVMAALREYHEAIGRLVSEFEGTLERFTGDGMMVFFNDPVPQDDAVARAVRMALAMRQRSREVSARWEARGFELSLGFGITRGLATLGAIGFDARSDYAAIGTVTRMAARLCEAAQPDEILVSRGVLDALGGEARSEPVGELTLRGFLRPVPAFRILEAGAAPHVSAPAASARQAHDVFRQEGEYWTVVFEGRELRLRDSKGMRYVAHLLRHPEHDFHALDLVALTRADDGDGGEVGGRTTSDLGDAGPVLDPPARSAYRRRLDELRAELAEADAFNDVARAARMRDEIDQLSQQLASAVGLGGRERRVGAAAERARVNVTRAISDAVKRIREHCPPLARHLDASIRTGTLCTYRPPVSGDRTWLP